MVIFEIIMTVSTLTLVGAFIVLMVVTVFDETRALLRYIKEKIWKRH